MSDSPARPVTRSDRRRAARLIPPGPPHPDLTGWRCADCSADLPRIPGAWTDTDAADTHAVWDHDGHLCLVLGVACDPCGCPAHLSRQGGSAAA